jgi:phosphatidylglycerophosphatase A
MHIAMSEQKKGLPKPHKNLIHFAAFGFGSGLAPKAPGTFGTVAGMVIYLLLLQDLSLVSYLAMLLATTVLGIYLCHKTALDLKVHDHPGIVWDEFVGYWITMLMAPPGLVWLLLGFVFFRFFDIVKPWPISWLDRQVGGGFGIMVDDILAGFFALAALQLTAYWLPTLSV